LAVHTKKELTTKANGVRIASFGKGEIALRGRRSIRFSLLVEEAIECVAMGGAAHPDR
jgi:hypothetical protein